MQNIADDLRLSVATVSYALSDNWQAKGISAQTRKMILTKVSQTNYRRNPIAMSLKTRRSMTLGVVVPTLSGNVYDQMLQGIQAVVGEDYTLLIGSSGYDAGCEQRILVSFRDRMVDGLVIVSTGAPSTIDTLQALRNSGTPVVQADRYADQLKTDVAVPDNEMLGKMLTEHLIDLGHRHIVYIQSSFDNSSTRGREEGYRKTMSCHGLPVQFQPDTKPLSGQLNRIDYGHEQMSLLLDQEPVPTGVIAHGYDIALGTIQAIEERGLRCPDDLSVCTVRSADDRRYHDILARIMLTSAEWSVEQMGRQAASFLLARIKNQDRRQRSTKTGRIPNRLVVGNSTAKPKSIQDIPMTSHAK